MLRLSPMAVRRPPRQKASRPCAANGAGPITHHINVGGEKLMTHLRRAIVLLFFSCCIAPLAMGQQLTLKVKIQSTAMERQLLFAKLNERAATHHIQFVLVEEGFDYRVAYGVAGPVMTPYGPADARAAGTKV